MQALWKIDMLHKKCIVAPCPLCCVQEMLRNFGPGKPNETGPSPIFYQESLGFLYVIVHNF